MPEGTVLIVEDDDSLRVALADALASLGYETIEAATGQEAYLLASQQVPDLILLDLGLPDVDGLFVARKLRERSETARIAVVALTAEEISGRRAEQVYEHCIGYIPKPVGLDRLAQSVNLFLRVGRPGMNSSDVRVVADDHPKRRHPRFTVEIGALCRFRSGPRQGGETRVAGLIRNLSEGGIMMELPQGRTRGTFLLVNLRAGESRLHATTEVVWSGPQEIARGAGQPVPHGLRFVQITQDQRNAIRRFIIKRLTS